MLGLREPEVYGAMTLDQLNEGLKKSGADLSAELHFAQSNIEGELVGIIQEARNRMDGIIINPGAFGHTSIAIRDALLSVQIPFIEVHISNTYSREEFRHKSYLADIASGIIIGFGTNGYELALRGLLSKLPKQQ